MADNKMEQVEPKEFELGKFYEHNCGKQLYICGVCETKAYGMCLMGEDRSGEFIPIGKHEGATVNWHEISKEEFLDGRE